MVHGEVVCTRINTGKTPIRIPNYNPGGTGNNLDVTGITRATNGVVTTALAHGFLAGDKIFHRITGVNQMTQLNLVPCTILSVGSPTTYTININTSGFTNWTGGTATGCANQWVTLQVGSGNDRIGYPIMFMDGTVFISEYGSPYLINEGYFPFYFDKNMVGSYTTGGTPNFGAWLVVASGNSTTGPHDGGVPIEFCTQAVVEANILAQSQGITNPIHLWICIPCRGLLSIDPDYSTASSWPRNAVNVALNGSTVNGVTYPGLKSITGPSLLIEFANETWNPLQPEAYVKQWGVNILGVSETSSASALRSTCMARDIQALGETRVKFVLSGQAALGYTGTQNQARCEGTTAYFSYLTAHSLSWGTPISNHDCFAYAPYIDPQDDYFTLTNALSFADDAAMYYGADNSGALNLTGTCPGTKTFTTTAANFTPVRGQVLVGSGLPVPAAGVLELMIVSATGSGNVWTITLNQNVTITAATVHSPSYGGSNYIGAQNQTQALNNLALAMTRWNGVGSAGEPLETYCKVSNPTAGLDNQYAVAMTSFGKKSIQYEGGIQIYALPPMFGGSSSSVAPDIVRYDFLTALYNSAQWGTAQTNYWNARAGLAGCGMPSIYYWGPNQGFNNDAITQYGIRWAYCSPDTYAGGVEGAALTNNLAWSAFASRNQAFVDCPAVNTPAFGFSVITDSGQRRTKMIGY